MKQGSDKRTCAFAVMTDTGEQPTSAIHAVAFDDGESTAVHVKQEGDIQTHVLMVCSIVESLGETIREKQGPIAAAAFVSALGDSMIKGAGHEAMKFATMLADPQKMGEAIKTALENMAEEIDEEDFV